MQKASAKIVKHKPNEPSKPKLKTQSWRKKVDWSAGRAKSLRNTHEEPEEEWKSR